MNDVNLSGRHHRGDYEGAIEAFDIPIKLGVKDETALNNRGSALADYSKCIEIVQCSQ